MFDLIIVGGGAFGLSTAFYAKESGQSVLLLDRSPIPSVDAATTDLNKIIRSDYGSDELYQEMGLRAIEIWKEWSRDCESRLGRTIFHQTGVAFLSLSQEPNGFGKETIKSLTKAGYAGDLDFNLTSSFPGLNTLKNTFPGGYVNTRAGWGNSGLASEYLSKRIEEMGVKIITGQKGTFTGLIMSQDKTRVLGVTTRDGSTHFATKVVIAAGSWTPSLIPELSSVLQSTGQPVIHIKIPPNLREKYASPHFGVWTADISITGFYGFPMNSDGILKIAHHGAGYINPIKGISTPRTVLSDPNDTIPRDALQRFKSFIKDCFPELYTLGITSTRMCWYTDSCDGDFYMCPSPTIPNLFYATGGSGHAFKFMPVLGQIMMDVIQNKSTQCTRRFRWRENDRDAPKEGARQQSNHGPQILDSSNMAHPSELSASTKSQL